MIMTNPNKFQNSNLSIDLSELRFIKVLSISQILTRSPSDQRTVILQKRTQHPAPHQHRPTVTQLQSLAWIWWHAMKRPTCRRKQYRHVTSLSRQVTSSHRVTRAMSTISTSRSVSLLLARRLRTECSVPLGDFVVSCCTYPMCSCSMVRRLQLFVYCSDATDNGSISATTWHQVTSLRLGILVWTSWNIGS